MEKHKETLDLSDTFSQMDLTFIERSIQKQQIHTLLKHI